jgi:hypothetical protein
MKFVDLVGLFSGHPELTRKRIFLALTVAVVTDSVQLGFGPLGWAFIDEGLDILAMLLISNVIGFHVLLLPTFIIEFIPGPDMLPTWTGCTAAVIILRKRAQQKASPTIDIDSEVTRVPPAEVDPSETQNGTNASPVPPVMHKT